MSGYGGFYGKKYTSQVHAKIARMLEAAGMPGTWRRLLQLAASCEAIVRMTERGRYEDWRDE